MLWTHATQLLSESLVRSSWSAAGRNASLAAMARCAVWPRGLGLFEDFQKDFQKDFDDLSNVVGVTSLLTGLPWRPALDVLAAKRPPRLGHSAAAKACAAAKAWRRAVHLLSGEDVVACALQVAASKAPRPRLLRRLQDLALRLPWRGSPLCPCGTTARQKGPVIACDLL